MRQAFRALRKRLGLLVLALAALVATASLAAAGPIAPTPYFGGYTVLVDGATVVSGAIGVTASGELYFGAPFSTVTSDHLATLTFSNISGQADPAIFFAVGAGNLSDVSRSFQFIFSIPVALDGTVRAYSSLFYSLYATGTADVAIAPTAATILTAFDSDTTIGGLGNFNKGVDTGSGFSLVGGPGILDSPRFLAANTFTGDLAYDLMIVNLGFTLTPSTGVNLAGYVEQMASPEPVPEPATLFMFGAGLLGIAARKRRSGK